MGSSLSYTAQYGGGTHYQTAKGNGIKNNGATVLWGGNINLAPQYPNVTQAPGNLIAGYHSGVNGSIIPGPFVPTPGVHNRCVRAAISNANYATMTAGRYIMMRFTNFVAGQASTILNNGAADFGRLPYAARVSNFLRTQRIITTGGWYYQTGQTVAEADFADSLQSETFPTRAIPGRIVFATSGQSRTKQNYAIKTD